MTFTARLKKNKDSRKAKPWRARLHSWYSRPMWLQHLRIAKKNRAIIHGSDHKPEPLVLHQPPPRPSERKPAFESVPSAADRMRAMGVLSPVADPLSASFALRRAAPLTEELRKAA